MPDKDEDVITLLQQKGGSGKTPTAVQLAFALAKKSKHVLFVDVDPQATATLHFLGTGYKTLQITVFNAITSTRNIEQVTRIEPIIVSEHLHLLPAHDELEQAEVLLTSKRTFEWQQQLKKLLSLYRGQYDFVVIDTPGSRVSIFPTLALVAANKVIVPVKTTFEAQQATVESMSLIDDIKTSLNPTMQVWGVVPNQFETTLHHQEVVDLLRESYPGLVWEPSRKSIKYAEALVGRQDIRELAKEAGIYWDSIALDIIQKGKGSHGNTKAS